MVLIRGDCIAGGTQLTSPSFADVENAIRTMDGEVRTEVGLFIDEDTYLQVGGGFADFTCALCADGKLHVLVDPSKDAEHTQWVVSGQGDHRPLNECHHVDDVVNVAKWFWNHRSASPEYYWKLF